MTDRFYIDRRGQLHPILAGDLEYLDRRGEAWAAWWLQPCATGRPAGAGVSSIYRNIGGGRGVNVIHELIDGFAGQAWDFDTAVAGLPLVLVRVCLAHYVSWSGADQRDYVSLAEAREQVLAGRGRVVKTAAERAAACDMRMATFYRQLGDAKVRIHSALATVSDRRRASSPARVVS